ncbi:uncharacterized protein LOC132615631 [Lycium barbarum]|uniref:uncharacterized protein LOC132615631 n=1 Tax=Lycium barbarum TaxID=112863 RepID=UPI00293EF52B|nr:uncharacterized protein LOC132615631 [Lycium barbarum]
MKWFQDEDRNTKFFHAHVNGKTRKLQLQRIQDHTGTWLDTEEEIAQKAIRFFSDQFKEENIPTDFSMLDKIPKMVTKEQNQQLYEMPDEAEVKTTVFGLNGGSAGGPDGFKGRFFQACWEIFANNLVNMVRSFFCGHELPSLSNITSKVISRIIHERLIYLLPEIISPQQSGFVKGEIIVENILLAQEIVHNIRIRGKPANVVIKLDMTKAYDRVSWLFLTKVLRRMGFGEFTIDMVFRVIPNNWYAILINGQPHGFFKSSKGVKQGDPLSPTLFILAIECLSRALNALLTEADYKEYGMPKWSPYIPEKDFPFTYLGVPIYYGRRMNIHYKEIIEKIQNRLSSWTGKLLSIGGRKTLIKHVLHSMHIHLLSACDPSSVVLAQIHSLFAKFFWSNSVGNSSKHWATWTTLCHPQKEGGMGFRSLQDISKSLFAKLWWNMRTKQSLWRTFMSNKYLKKFHAVIAPSGSGTYVWKKMIKHRDEMEHEIWWKFQQDFECDPTIILVKETAEVGKWDEQLLRRILPEDLADHIVQHINPPNENGQADKRYSPKRRVTPVIWRTPDIGWIKVNTDGTSRGSPGRSSWAFCVRDERGDVIQAQSREIEDLQSTNTEAEALAILQALGYLKDNQ